MRYWRDWSSDVCSSDLHPIGVGEQPGAAGAGSAAPLPAALDEATLGGLSGLRRSQQRGELGQITRRHAGQPFIGEDRHTLRSRAGPRIGPRSEEHTSELQSRQYLVCRLLLEKKKKKSRSPSCTLNIKH